MKRYSPVHVLPRTPAWPRPGRRVSAAAAGALLCAAAGCIIAPAEPGEPRKVGTSFTLEDTSGAREYGVFLRLDESATERGVFTGTMAVNGEVPFQGRAVELTQVEATMVDGALRVPAGELLVGPSAFYFAWETITLRLEDEDGDGVLESGTGRMSGSIYDSFTAARDGYAAQPQAYRAGVAADVMLPWEDLYIDFDQPIGIDAIERYRVLADGQEVAGSFAFEDQGGLHMSVRFTPDDYLPLGAVNEFEADGLTNFIGAPVVVAQPSLPILPDPGAFSTNLGFEQSLAGWYTNGDVSVIGRAGELLPVEGAGMAALRTLPGLDENVARSSMFGYLDVPADATVLDLSLALLATADELPASFTVHVHRLLPEGGHMLVESYEFDHEAAVFEPCDCGVIGDDPPLTRRAGPFRHEIDLTGFRGERVFVELRLYGEPWSGRSPFAVAPIPPPLPPILSVVLVDDLQIR